VSEGGGGLKKITNKLK